MRILKKIGIALLVIIVLLLIISAFLPGKRRVERSMLINAPASVVFDQVNTLKNWKSWSYWDNIDSAMVSNYEGPESGVGARHIWKSDNKDVGHGSLEISESTPNKSVGFILNFEDMGPAQGGWTFRDTTGGTWATTYMNMELPFAFRIMGLMMDGWLGADFEKSLEGLKKVSERNATNAPSTEYTVEIVTTKPMIIASTRMMTSDATITADIGSSYQKIGQFMGKNKLNFAGPVFAFYHSYSSEKIDMECAIPVDKEIASSDSVTVKKMEAGPAALIRYYGDYAGTIKAHEAMDKWLTANKKSLAGSPYEVYVTDPMVEKDTAKWLTEIYYPLGK
jgi:effector-binding domain-containing protein